MTKKITDLEGRLDVALKRSEYPKIWDWHGIWHYKKTKRSMTRLYPSKRYLLADHPELTEESGGTMFFAHMGKP